MPIELIFGTALSLAAVCTDIKKGKISNKMVVPAFLGGLLWQMSEAGTQGLQDGMCGGLFPLILFPFFIMRMLGAGDIKLMMAIGTWLGLRDSASLLVASILCGGAMAMIVMATHRNCAKRFKKIWVYGKSCILCRMLLPYQDFGRLENGTSLPFALAIFGGMMGLVAMGAGVLPLLV